MTLGVGGRDPPRTRQSLQSPPPPLQKRTAAYAGKGLDDLTPPLDALLDAIPNLVKPGGRVVLLTFMSIEDRKVKQSFQALQKDGRMSILTRHVVRPTEEEVRDNPPSRSAKLRAVEIL